MSKMIDLGDMIIRISSKDSHRLERSINGGRTWLPHWDRQLFEFRDLMDRGDELLAETSKGLYRSVNKGQSWSMRSR